MTYSFGLDFDGGFVDDPCKPRNPNHLEQAKDRQLLLDQVKRERRQDIDSEWASQILRSNFWSVSYFLAIKINKYGIESDQDIDEEKCVDRVVNDDVFGGLWPRRRKCDGHGHRQGVPDGADQHEQIPVELPLVLLWNQR